MYVPAHEDSPSAIGLELSEITFVDKKKKKRVIDLFISDTLHKNPYQNLCFKRVIDIF